ncbi:MAG: CoA transferase [Alphaproteobacteria bacterium]|nr:MAG: CoA transferase [Alphaproteobacteria bacterium]
MPGVLDGIRVLDFGRYVAGPYCATLLGYLGAEVIRIEKRSGGEDRYIAPLFKRPDGSDGEGGVFLQTSCNKKSMTLKPTTDEGRDIMRRLVATADVVVANLPAAALKSLGLDYDSLKAIKPDIILVAQSAFGPVGPDARRGGFDGIGQAMSGAMYMTGTPGHPVKAAAPYVDYTTAVLSAFGALAALMEREKTGKGQEVQATLLGTALAVFNSHLIEQGVLGINRLPTGNRVQTSAPSDVFETRDGHILVHTVGNGLFRRWANLVGRPELADDPRFQSDQARGDHRDEICAVMAEWCAKRTSDEAIAALEEAGLAAGPVLDLQQAIDNPQVAAMGLLKEVSFSGAPRPAPVADLPIKFSETEAGITAPPPALGEHTDTILAELGYSPDDIAKLRDNGII